MFRRHILLPLLLICAGAHAADPVDQPGLVEHPVPVEDPLVVAEDQMGDAPWTATRSPADPWEGFNRRIYAFNEVADRWVLRPVASGYRTITPDPVQRGVGNFFNNISEVSNVLNNLLQGKVREGATDASRLVINTTVGVAGLFDVAGRWGLPPSNEDFGQTLGAWGVDSGPYLVVPLLGPRTVRDGFGTVVDGYSDPVAYIGHDPTRIGLLGLRIVDTRAALIPTEEMIRGDRYLFLRDAYLQRREFLVQDGAVEDDFGTDDYDDWPEWE